ncbi:MAG: M48 family metallopeptidase [Verrucomicrobiota bacterium]
MDVASSVAGLAGVDTGLIDSGTKVVRTGAKALSDFTPENRYYIGRTVSAMAFQKAAPYENATAHAYLNLLGQTLAHMSDKPTTWKGYHFQILDSDIINAYAAPGGFILITRGLIRCCRNEAELAAVLAHEIAHVQLDHGMAAIKKGRRQEALFVLGAEVVRHEGGAGLVQALNAFEGVVNDVFHTIADVGYGPTKELEADATAVTLLQRVGYNPAALSRVLEELEKRYDPAQGGLAKTHPHPRKRIEAVNRIIGDAEAVQPAPERQARFDKHLAGI